jgi:hypothetical protein
MVSQIIAFVILIKKNCGTTTKILLHCIVSQSTKKVSFITAETPLSKFENEICMTKIIHMITYVSYFKTIIPTVSLNTQNNHLIPHKHNFLIQFV